MGSLIWYGPLKLIPPAVTDAPLALIRNPFAKTTSMPPGIFVDSMILEPAGRLSRSVAIPGAMASFRWLSSAGTIDLVTESIGRWACESRPETLKQICAMVHIRNKTAETARSPFIRMVGNIISTRRHWRVWALDAE